MEYGNPFLLNIFTFNHLHGYLVENPIQTLIIRRHIVFLAWFINRAWAACGRSNAAEQMTQNRTNLRERKIASMWHVCSTCFCSILHLKTSNWGNVCVESSSATLFFRYRENVALKMYEINVSISSFCQMYTVNGWENALVDMFRFFSVRFRLKNGFCVLVDVHEMAKISESPM